jgi:hypothetical protein
VAAFVSLLGVAWRKFKPGANAGDAVGEKGKGAGGVAVLGCIKKAFQPIDALYKY